MLASALNWVTGNSYSEYEQTVQEYHAFSTASLLNALTMQGI